MSMLKLRILVLTVLLPGCASLNQSNRMLAGAGVGAALGAGGGAIFSPNEESRGMNALVFGLSGALVGGAIGFLTSGGEMPKSTAMTLEAQEIGTNAAKDYPVSQNELPEFLKKRMTPAIVEEFVEQDTITEDGSLHEPHKVYRIKRPAELISKPQTQSGVNP